MEPLPVGRVDNLINVNRLSIPPPFLVTHLCYSLALNTCPHLLAVTHCLWLVSGQTLQESLKNHPFLAFSLPIFLSPNTHLML